MPKAFSPFPTYDDDFQAIVAAIPGAVDDSWHNDTCPKFLAKMGEGLVIVFCEWKDVDYREYSDVPRFCVYHLDPLLGIDDAPFITFETLPELVEEFHR